MYDIKALNRFILYVYHVKLLLKIYSSGLLLIASCIQVKHAYI